MYKAAVRWMIRRNVAALARGDTGPVMAGYAHDAVLVFPGDNTWSGEYTGKAAIEGFMRRFVDDGITGEVQDVLINGPPWRTRVAVVFVARAQGPDGQLVYDNRAVLYGQARWGKITRQEDFEDTQKAAAFADYVAGRSAAPGAPSS